MNETGKHGYVNIRRIALLGVIASFVSLFSFADRTHDATGMIHEYPSSLVGRWRIGDLALVATNETKFDFGKSSPAVGSISEVEYRTVDGIHYAVEIVPQEAVPDSRLNDGPYVSSIEGAFVDEIVVTSGTVQRRRIDPDDWSTRASEFRVQLRRAADGPAPATVALSDRLLAVSDIHGNYPEFRDFLIGNGVIDESLRWSYGSGQLIVVGDVFDRGEGVTDMLWLLYKLEVEAKRAGGGAYLLLGNHEVMALAGDLRYVATKYAYIAEKLDRSYPALFSASMELGRWLRERNSMMRIGDLLFVHGGVSEDVLDQQATIASVNEDIRSILGTPKTKIDRDRPGGHYLAWNQSGILWFRGSVRDAAQQTSVVDRALDRFDASSIVVGHTMLEAVTDIYSDQRVIAVGVPWTDSSKTRGLLVMKNRMYQVDVDGQPQPLRTGVGI